MNAIEQSAFFDELIKMASFGGLAKSFLKKVHGAGEPIEVAGLAVLAAPAIDNMIAKRRARNAGFTGHLTDKTLNKFRVLKESTHDAIESGGLGLLAAPYISGRIVNKRWGH